MCSQTVKKGLKCIQKLSSPIHKFSSTHFWLNFFQISILQLSLTSLNQIKLFTRQSLFKLSFQWPGSWSLIFHKDPFTLRKKFWNMATILFPLKEDGKIIKSVQFFVNIPETTVLTLVPNALYCVDWCVSSVELMMLTFSAIPRHMVDHSQMLGWCYFLHKVFCLFNGLHYRGMELLWSDSEPHF